MPTSNIWFDEWTEGVNTAVSPGWVIDNTAVQYLTTRYSNTPAWNVESLTTLTRERSPDMERSRFIHAALAYLFEHKKLPDWSEAPYDGREVVNLYQNTKTGDIWIRNVAFESWLAVVDVMGHRLNCRQDTVYETDFRLFCEKHNYKFVQPPHFFDGGDAFSHRVTEVGDLYPEEVPMT